MKFVDFYKDILNCSNENSVFDYLVKNFQGFIADWSFFVEWEKIKFNVEKIETELNILNSLIGKDNLEDKFIEIISEYPKTRLALPMLIAIRKDKLKEMPILKEKQSLMTENKEYLFNDKTVINDNIKNELIIFFNQSGLKQIFEDKTIKNLVDYSLGVEVGMDTNARKNRGGHNMENLVELFIKEVCEKNKYEYLKEANAHKIKEKWGYDVPVDKSSRRYDFVVNNKKELFIIETNFYGGGGSKLKSTAGEYRNLFDVLKNKYKFIWITDGCGWKTTLKPLRETFDHNDYLINLDIMKKGVLENIFKC